MTSIGVMVERAAKPRVSSVRRQLTRVARSMTHPLLPDDYLALLDPRWSAAELTGTIVEVRRETPDASTVVIRPSFPWPGHRPGQYLRIGAELDGRRHWRAYSLTSDPDHPDGLVSVTIKTVPDGRMSPWFTRHARPGTMVFLGEVEGEFRLPDPAPEKVLFLSAGSGITPIWSLLRELERQGRVGDLVHVHGARHPEDVIFRPSLHATAERHAGYRLHEHFTSERPRLEPADLDELVPDWREREVFLSGPQELLDAMVDHLEAAGRGDHVHLERFQPIIGTGDAEVGSGGTVRFRVTDVDATCDVGVSILVGGEEAGGVLPYGCRMGICHTCVGKLCAGQVRDLRTGEVHGDVGQTIRTCVNAPEGHVEIEL